MIEGFRLTIYDLFGYFLPGVVTLVSVVIGFWSLFLPRVPLALDKGSAEQYWAAGIAAYFLGHCVQAAGNAVAKKLSTPEDLVFGERATPADHAIAEGIKNVLSSWGIKTNSLSSLWLFRLCDERVVQTGNTRNREIYIYREGFYRGAFIAFAMLTVAELLRICMPSAVIAVGSKLFPVTRAMLLYVLLSTALCAAASLARLNRFGEHRVRGAASAFLVLHHCDTTKKGNVGEEQ